MVGDAPAKSQILAGVRAFESDRNKGYPVTATAKPT
jgi:hypothetical protein